MGSHVGIAELARAIAGIVGYTNRFVSVPQNWIELNLT
jgi:hypothetical protein